MSNANYILDQFGTYVRQRRKDVLVPGMYSTNRYWLLILVNGSNTVGCWLLLAKRTTIATTTDRNNVKTTIT